MRRPVPPLIEDGLAVDGVAEDGPDDPGRARRLEWASLLKRAWPVPLLAKLAKDGDADDGRAEDGPDDPGRARRLELASLLKRAWLVDVLCCPRCRGPMRIVSFIEHPFVARKILEHLGLPARAPPRGRQAWQRRNELPVHEGPFVNTHDALNGEFAASQAVYWYLWAPDRADCTVATQNMTVTGGSSVSRGGAAPPGRSGR